MKRAISLLLCIVMLMSLVVVPAFATDTNRFIITANKTEVQPGEEVVFTITMEAVNPCDITGMLFDFDRDAFEFVGGKYDRNFAYDDNDDQLVLFKDVSIEPGKEGFAISFSGSVTYTGKVGTVTLRAKEVTELTQTVFTAKPYAMNVYDTVEFAVNAVNVAVVPVPETEPTVPTTAPTIPETEPTVPTTAPTIPETEPTVPTTAPTVPETEPTVPETEPTVPEVPETNRFVITADKTEVQSGEQVVLTIAMEAKQANDVVGLMFSFDRDVFEFVGGKYDRSFAYNENDDQLALFKDISVEEGKEGFAISFKESVVYSGIVGTVTLKAKEVTELTQTVFTADASAMNEYDTVAYAVDVVNLAVAPAPAEPTEPSVPETEPTEPSVPETEPTEPSAPETEPTVPDETVYNRFLITANKTEVKAGEDVVFTVMMETEKPFDSVGLLFDFDRDVFEFVGAKYDRDFAYDENDNQLVLFKDVSADEGKEGFAVSFNGSVVYSGKVGTVTLKAKDVADLTQTMFTAKSSANNGYDTVDFDVDVVGLTIVPAPAEPTEPSVPETEPTEPSVPETEPTEPSVPETEPSVPETEPTIPPEEAPNQFVISTNTTEVFPGDQIVFEMYVDINELTRTFGVILEFDRDVFELVSGKFDRNFGYDDDDNQIVLVKTFSTDDKPGVAVSFDSKHYPTKYYAKVGTFTLKVKEGAEFTTAMVTGRTSTESESGVMGINAVAINKHAHSYTTYEAKEPTCTDSGWYEYKVCAGCGDTDFVERPATGHAWTSYEEVAPTCETEGNIAYMQCLTCGAAQTMGTNPKPLGNLEWVLSATGHALEHYDAVEATCVDNGHEAFDYCTNCECFFYEDPLKLTYQAGVILATGHTWTNYEAVAPTCETEGNIAYQQCSVCGAAQTWEENPVPLGKLQWILGATGHALEHYDAVEPTCVDNGHEAFDYCTNCECFFYEDPLKLTYQAGVILANGHTWENHEAIVPTCEQGGNVAYQLCTICGAAQTWEENPVPLSKFGWIQGALGHNFVEGVCTHCDFLAGDIDRNGVVDNVDVVVLLWHSLFPEDYQITAGGDTDSDGDVDNDDVVYLLWHTLFSQDYPLYVTPAEKKYQ